MGYTHYWTHKRDFTDEEWDYACTFFHKGLELLAESLEYQTTAHNWGDDPVIICGWDGEGEPRCDQERISFNGAAMMDLDHETFQVFKKVQEDSWDFCKTARKPYDVLVVAMLMMFHQMNPSFTWSSDGGDCHSPAMDGGRKLYNDIKDAIRLETGQFLPRRR